MTRSRLGDPPHVDIAVESDHTASSRADEGFLRVRRLSLRNKYPDDTESEIYRYDVIERDAMDAVGIVLEAVSDDGPLVCLRSALRPPLAFRSTYAVPLADEGSAVLWEIPAGLIEPSERGEAGIVACAARETLEEVGLVVSPERFEPLGRPACLSPGVMGEKVHFVHAVVDPTEMREPLADGSPVEERADIRFVTIDDALEAVRDGRVADAKTEVAVRRLAERRSRW